MRVVGLLLLLSGLLAAAFGAASYRGHKVYRLVPSAEQLDAVALLRTHPDLDFWSGAHLAGHPVDVRVPPHLHNDFRAHLDHHGVMHRLLINDTQHVLEKERARHQQKPTSKAGRSPRITFDQYYTHEEINEYLAELAADYPDTVTVQTIGTSYEGRSMNLIQISSGGDGTRPVILLDAGIHAREWIAPAAALYIIQQLVEDAEDSALAAAVDWHILPVLNPDGYDYTFTDERLWRKTRSDDGSLCLGVDGNRNFDFHWMENGASSISCVETYAGREAFSELETQALRDYALANADRIKLYLTLHSYGPYILYPWGYTSDLPDDWETLDALAQSANAAQMAAGGPAYTIGSSTNVLYAAAGGSDDYCKGVAGIALSYTIELPGGGDNGFDMPADEIQSTVTPFFEAIRVYGQYIEDNFA